MVAGTAGGLAGIGNPLGSFENFGYSCSAGRAPGGTAFDYLGLF